jgi:hypothetical protein
MCDKCHRFFVISYEKNEKGETVEVGHELDIRVKSSGIIRADEEEWQRSLQLNRQTRKNLEETCW